MPGTVAPVAKQKFWGHDNAPLANGLIDVYAAGTTNRVKTYTDAALTVEDDNPIELDAYGEATIFLAPSSYRFDLKTATGAGVWSVDFVSSVPPSNVDVDVTGVAGEVLVAGEAVYLSNGSGGKTAGRWYKADADLTYASSEAVIVGMAVAALAAAAAGTFRLVGRMATGLAGLTPGSTYYVSTVAGEITTVEPTNSRILGLADSSTSLVIAPNPATNARGLDFLQLSVFL